MFSQVKIFIFKIEPANLNCRHFSPEKIYDSLVACSCYDMQKNTQKIAQALFLFQRKKSAYIKTDFFCKRQNGTKKCITNRDFTFKNLIPYKAMQKYAPMRSACK
jgi:hypothetical protein